MYMYPSPSVKPKYIWNQFTTGIIPSALSKIKFNENAKIAYLIKEYICIVTGKLSANKT